MGRKAQPIDLLVLKGKKHLTKQEIEERRAAEARVKPKADKVRCPKWLDSNGRKEWRRICAELKELDLLTNVDVSSLAVYCDLVSKYIAATKDVQERGLILRSSLSKDESGKKEGNVSSSPAGVSKLVRGLLSECEDDEVEDNVGMGKLTITFEQPNPSAAQAQKYAQLIKAYLVEFGLSPSARAKLRPPKEPEGQASPFDKRFGNVV
jgi:P27 family predicted phage terminase small subunit